MQALARIHEALPEDRHPAAVYVARLGAGSRATMMQALDRVAELASGGEHDARSFPWEHLRYQHTAAIRTRLVEAHAPATVNKMLSALRGVLKEAWRLGHLTAEEYHRAADVSNVKVETLPSGRALAHGEVGKLLQACQVDISPAGRRDAALVAMLCTTGLRRSEVVNLDASDYNSQDGSLMVRQGKGRKDRMVYVVNEAAMLLGLWLEDRGQEGGALFCPVKGGKVTIRRMTGQAILYILRKRAEGAGVVRFSPHDLRRTFISNLLDAGADLVTVQQLAGHARVETTARYDRRGEDAKRRAAGLLRLRT